MTDFEAEWAALPTGEGVTLEGEPFPGEEPTPERLERAHAFMRRLEAEQENP